MHDYVDLLLPQLLALINLKLSLSRPIVSQLTFDGRPSSQHRPFQDHKEPSYSKPFQE